MRRGVLFLLVVCAALLGSFGQRVQADDGLPIEFSEGDECAGLAPHLPTNLTRQTIRADVVIALDGVSIEQAKAIVAEGSKPYAPGTVPQLTPDIKINPIAYHDLAGKLTGDIVSGFITEEEPQGTDLMSQLIRFYKTNYPTLKRHHVHLLTTRDVAAELVPGQREYAVAGIANCIGGVGTKNAYAITEVGTLDVPIMIGPLAMAANVEAKNFAHEMGHVFGAHHHYADCATNAVTGLAAKSGDVCSVMFNDLSLLSLHFSTAETRGDPRIRRSAYRGDEPAEVTGAETLRAELQHHLQRLPVASAEEHDRRRTLLPRFEPVADPLRRADETRRVGELVRDGSHRFLLLAVEIEVLDLLRRGLVAVPAREVVVEVLPARAHAADVQRESRLHEAECRRRRRP